MAHNSFRASLASRVKSQDQDQRTLAGICVSAMCYQDFASQQDSPRDPEEEFFSWRDPGKYRFLGILADMSRIDPN